MLPSAWILRRVQMANIDLPAEPGFGERPAKRDDGSMEGRKNEGELDREILRRAKRVREPAAESLRRSRVLPKRKENRADRANAAEKPRRARRWD